MAVLPTPQTQEVKGAETSQPRKARNFSRSCIIDAENKTSPTGWLK